MRITTANAFDATVETLSQRQSELNDAQYRIGIGKRVLRASDDPIAAARAERALASLSRTSTSQRALDASRSAMTQIESTLGSASDLLQTAREALVSGGNAAFNDDQRQMLASQIRDLRTQLLALANSGDGAGGYLFSGQGSSLPPFLDAAGGVQYVGTRGENLADRGEGLPVTMDGAAAWMTAGSGNGVFETRAITSTGSAWIDGGSVTDPAAVTGSTYRIAFSQSGGATTYSIYKDGVATAQANVPFVAGQAIQVDGMSTIVSGQPADGDAFELAPSQPTLSVFDVLDKAAADLATPSQSASARAQYASDNLRNLDAVLARLSDARTMAGTALNRIDSTAERLDAAQVNAKSDRAAAEDLDMPAAISDFQNRQTSYQAALQTYATVQRLSLFDYIR